MKCSPLFMLSARWILLTLFLGSTLWAEKADPAPDALKDWKSWVLDEIEGVNSPQHYGTEGWERQSWWPSYLHLNQKNDGLDFRLEARIYDPSLLPLPGGLGLWPMDVRVGDQPGVIIDEKGVPHIYLLPGRHSIMGSFKWKTVPSKLRLPKSLGVLQWLVNGEEQKSPHVDERGWLWFQKAKVKRKSEEELLDVKVFRKLVDEWPMEMEVQVWLGVSGRERVEEMGPLLLPGFELIQLDSPLPARVESSGNLRVQLRSGQFRLSFKARQLSPWSKISLAHTSPFWPVDEIWSFEQRRNLRQVQVKGVDAVDPQQQNMPEPWKSFPSYVMTKGLNFELFEISRGEDQQSNSQLKSQRSLWLDMDGEGFTVKDELKGTLHRDWRLNMLPPYELGSASVNGGPRLITLSEKNMRGLELREHDLKLKSLARVQNNPATWPATAWDHDLSSLTIDLHLPPAWELLHVVGPEKVRGSWVSKWNLFEVFLVLLLTFGTVRVIGLWWGIGVLLFMCLSYHSEGAPRFVWFNFLLAFAILKWLPEGWWSKVAKVWAIGAFLWFAFFAFSFSGAQVRDILYPQLDHEENEEYEVTMITSLEEEEGELDIGRDRTMLLLSSSGPQRKSRNYRAEKKQEKTIQDAIQTGPGLPEWKGRLHQLQWKGPVSVGETFELTLLPPFWWKVVRGLRAFLVLCLMAGVARRVFSLKKISINAGLSPMILVLISLLISFSEQSLQAEIPSKELLESYKEKLMKLPTHRLAVVRKGQVEVNEDRLTLTLAIDVHQRCYLPILDKGVGWSLLAVTVGGVDLDALRRNDKGQLECALEAGFVDVKVELSATEDFVQLTFPMAVRNMKVHAPLWIVRGQGSWIAGTSLEFERQTKADAEEEKENLQSNDIAPFVFIHRSLSFDLDWLVTTRVERLAPKDTPFHVSIPQVTGEKLLDGAHQLEAGVHQLRFARGQSAMVWTSILEEKEAMTLSVPKGAVFREEWSLSPSPRWRMKVEGVPAFKTTRGRHQFRPLPGESLRVTLQSLKAAKGNLKTIDSLRVSIAPGAKKRDVKVELAINASLGGKEQLVLPANMELESVTRDNVPQFLRLEDQTLSLPLKPGQSHFVILLKEHLPLDRTWRSPKVIMETEVNNVELNVDFPEDRWVLGLGGPANGPALLFWGILILMVLMGVALPWIIRRLGWSIPMGTITWVLLLAGFCTITPWVNLLFVTWFLLLAWRGSDNALSSTFFNLRQALCIFLSSWVLVIMIGSIPYSLLGSPNMMITGAHSWNSSFEWFQDRTHGEWPIAWVYSLPLWVYRVGMLLWSLWLAFSVFKWLGWAWGNYSKDRCWARSEPKKILKRKPSFERPVEDLEDEASDSDEDDDDSEVDELEPEDDEAGEASTENKPSL